MQPSLYHQQMQRTDAFSLIAYFSKCYIRETSLGTRAASSWNLKSLLNRQPRAPPQPRRPSVNPPEHMPDTPTMTTTVIDPADIERVKASIENWKRKLLDLTKRNRALNFKVNKVSTITIVDELPAEVFRQLYLQEHAMRFKAAPESNQLEAPTRDRHRLSAASDLDEEAQSSAGFEEEDLDQSLHSDFVPYDPDPA